MMMKRLSILLIFFIYLNNISLGQLKNTTDVNSLYHKVYRNSQKFVESLNYKQFDNYQGRGKIKSDTLIIRKEDNTIHLYLNKFLSEAPIRQEFMEKLSKAYLSYLPKELKKYTIKIYSDNIELKDYIPNYYRLNQEEMDSTRLPQKNNLRPVRKNVVENVKPFKISNGLFNANIALWGSHGWYYENALDRWEWQRARLFTTVEDLNPSAFVLTYIIPMLNNAGAFVMTPRERDIQLNEILIDNDSIGKVQNLVYPVFLKKSKMNTGYGKVSIITENDNPFRKGTFLFGRAEKTDSVQWFPEFPESGSYWVYVAYGYVKDAAKLRYRIYDEGGYSDYLVDQSMGYGTWIPLGKHFFKKGMSGRQVLYVDKGQTFSIDAVKFGGGMGNVSRNGKVSGKPRFMEGPRYNIQYSGFVDTLIWKQNGEDKDYTDNYRSIGDWLNYLVGKPFGPKKDSLAGIGIPIDLSLAFHTDAGILDGDSVVGTLGIYSTGKDNVFFADGQSRFASRDLTDLIQNQIVEDIRTKYNKNWTRRGMWNSEYGEAYKPNVPAMLLELLSHQNPNEVKLALDPNFRFDVSRAIYKGMLRFISRQYGYDYVVQPLPVSDFKTEWIEPGKIRLSWKSVVDPIEPTAIAEKFMVYTRIGDSGFDQGKLTDTNEIIIDQIENNKVYSFKVAAINKGGESFPSEILSVGFTASADKPVLIVNGFDRLESPEYIETETFAGFFRQLDQGVPYLYDFHTTGDQHDFDPKSPWLDDDCPGFGASYADEENLIYPGNTFDFPAIHGQAALNNGYSFISTSDEAFINSEIKKEEYLMVDFIFGEEKTKKGYNSGTPEQYKIFTSRFIQSLEKINENRIPVFISGSYIGSEIGRDTAMVKKIGGLLGYTFRTGHAVRNGNVYITNQQNHSNKNFEFVTRYNKNIYPAEAPDAIEPFSPKSKVIVRYSENNMSAGVYSNSLNKVLALGFPFECISNSSDRDRLMKIIIEQLKMQ